MGIAARPVVDATILLIKRCADHFGEVVCIATCRGRDEAIVEMTQQRDVSTNLKGAVSWSMRIASVAIVTCFVFGMPGCSCDPPSQPGTGDEPALKFVDVPPAIGDVDDVDEAASGVQLDVTLKLVDAPSTFGDVVVTNAATEQQVRGTFVNNEARVRVTFVGSTDGVDNVLLAQARAGSGSAAKTIEATVTVRVTSGEREPVLILSPVAGQTYGPSDDVDGDASNGISLPLSVRGPLAAEMVFAVTCDGQPAQAGRVALTPEGNHAVAETTMTNLVGSNCVVSVDVDGDVAELAFFINAADAVLLDVVVQADADGDGFFEVEDDANNATPEIDVTVTITPTLPSGSYVGQLTISDDASPVFATDTFALSAGQPSTFTVPLPLGDNRHLVVAVVAENVDSGERSATFGGDIVVDTVAPTASFFNVFEGAYLNAGDDADADADGMQARVLLNVSADVVSCAAQVDGATQSGSVANTLCVLEITLADAAHTISATVVDGAGHTGFAPLLAFTSDNTVPLVQTVVIEAAGDDLVVNVADVGVSQTGDITTRVIAVVSPELEGENVSLSFGTVLQTTTVTAGAATFSGVVLAQGVTELALTGTDDAGNTLASLTRVVVDTIAPALTVDAPAAGDVNRSNDADGDAANGLQIDVVAVTDADAVVVNGGASPVTATADNGVAVARVTLPDGAATLSVSARDDANNTTSATLALTVDGASPIVTLLAPSVVGPVNDTDAVARGVQLQLSVVVDTDADVIITSDSEGDIGRCAVLAGVTTSCDVQFLSTRRHEVVARATESAGNTGASAVQFIDVDSGIYFVQVTAPSRRAGMLSIGANEDTNPSLSGAQLVLTALTDAPEGASVGISVDSNLIDVTEVAAGGTISAVVTLTATSGVIEVEVDDGNRAGSSGALPYHLDLGRPTTTLVSPSFPAVFAQAQDAATGTPGLQTVVTVAVSGCENGELRIVEGNTTLGRVSVSASGNGTFAVAVSDTTGGASQWQAQCTDVDGNTAEAAATGAVDVDVIAPSAPTLTVVRSNRRAGTATLSFVQPGDDGVTGRVVSAALVASPNDLKTSNFASAPRVFAVSSDTVDGGSVQQVNLTGLTPGTRWSVGYRATDDVGNVSRLVVVVIDMRLSSLTLLAPGGVRGYAQALSRSRGDINGDGFDDIVVGAPDQFSGGSGRFEVVLGAATPTAISRRVVVPPASFPCTAGSCTPLELGWAVNIIPSLNGDAFDEVLVVGYDANFTQEFLLIYAGSPVGLSANATPVAVLEASGFGFAGFNARPIGDVNNDGRIDWGFTAYNLAEAYVFLNTGSFPTSGLIEDRASVVLRHSDPEVFFGAAIEGVNDVTGDGIDDFVISSTFPGAMFVMQGRAPWPSLIDAVDEDNSFSLVQPSERLPGYDISAGDFDADGHTDIGYYATNGLHVVHGGAQGFGSEISLLLSTTLANNSAQLIADVTGDGAAEAIAGGNDGTRVSLFLGGTFVTRAPDLTFASTRTSTALQIATVQLLEAGSLPDIVIADGANGGRVTISY